VDILAGITGVEEWDRILLNSRMQKNSLQKTVQSTLEQISFEKGGLEQLNQQLQQYEQTDWGMQKKEYEVQLEAQGKLKTSVEKKMSKVSQDVEKLTKDQQAVYASSGITALSQEISDLSIEEAKLRNPQNLEESLPSFNPGLDQNVLDAKARVDQAKGQITVFLRDGDLRDLDVCPLCDMKITKVRKGEMQKHLKELQERVTELEKLHQSYIEARDAAHQEIQEARVKAYTDLKEKADEVAATIAQKQAQMQQSSSEYERMGEEIRKLSQEHAQLQGQLSQVQVEINNYTEWLKQVDKTIESMEGLKETIGDRKIKIAGMENSIQSSQDELVILDWLISNIPYIKLHKMSVTMVALSDKVNKFLGDMGDTTRVNISSFDEKKAKKGAGDVKDLLKAEIKVEVVDGEKNIDPRLYSDGETAKISNALIRGLHDLAGISGQGCNIILLDEIFAFVDVANSQRIVDSFVNLSAATTLVTDNSGHVNDLLAFNETWVAKKTAGITTLGVQ
jgi:DNA repair exonuclease SbcCD ATPase subunit